ncbi:hypothetical protein LTR84_012959 [Exophiala bonariae]|uniref:Uncharacterized protein n=1 Tax=Exophiala bonariae TaxID=1690606 RepID=A0AAV9NFZ9_9EURO|nr:hypothetical protein LTR84_012959 [Exophiala bonariae]
MKGPIITEAFIPKYLGSELKDQPSLADQLEDRETLRDEIEGLIREYGWVPRGELRDQVDSPPVLPKTVPITKIPHHGPAIIHVARPFWSKNDSTRVMPPPDKTSEENLDWIEDPHWTPQPEAVNAETELPSINRVLKRKRELGPNIFDEQAGNISNTLAAGTREIGSLKGVQIGTPHRPVAMNSFDNAARPLGRQPRPPPPKEYKNYDTVSPSKSTVIRDAARTGWPSEEYYYQHRAKGTTKFVDRILAGTPIGDVEKDTFLPRDEILHRVCMLASTYEKILEGLAIDRTQLHNIAGRFKEGNGEEIDKILMDQKKNNPMRTAEEEFLLFE